MKTIKIKAEKGEVNSVTEHFKMPNGIQRLNCLEQTTYRVDCSIVQVETNAVFNQQKHFEDVVSAENYMRKFIQYNPLSEVMLIKMSKQELYIYE